MNLDLKKIKVQIKKNLKEEVEEIEELVGEMIE